MSKLFCIADGDQHPHPTKEDEHTGPKLDEGKENSHKGNDPMDSRSLSNRANAEKKGDAEGDMDSDRAAYMKSHPTSVARGHGKSWSEF